MEGEVLSRAIYVRVGTNEQATVIQNALGFSRFLFVESLAVGQGGGFPSKKG